MFGWVGGGEVSAADANVTSRFVTAAVQSATGGGNIRANDVTTVIFVTNNIVHKGSDHFST